MSAPRLSVIIPTLNEANTLPQLLNQLDAQRKVTLEILIADGGSIDETAAIARARNARLIEIKQRGRGVQMNRAVAEAAGDELLFLHADSGLPDPDLLPNALAALDAQRATHGDQVAGHFPVRFVDPPFEPPILMRWFAAKSHLNRPECILGDRGMLLSRRFFQQLGPFSEALPCLEDLDFSARVARNGLWITLPGAIETSARRFRQEGVWRRSFLNALILTAWQADFHPFLAASPALYRAQHATRRLHIRPFLQLIHQLDQGERAPVVWKRWYRLTRSMRRSLFWQLFFLFDLLVTPLRPSKTHPVLSFYDHLLDPLLDWIPLDLLLTPLLRSISKHYSK
ncbi:MAG: TIGR04283 family arsenosugar biosynthesis glycosyltransferase [Magnetococcus sp. YQC-9]